MRRTILTDIARVWTAPPGAPAEPPADGSGLEMWPRAFLSQKASHEAALHGLKKAAAWRATRPLSRLGGFFHPKDARVDEHGHIVLYSHYGRCDSVYGWEIDHRYPTAAGGTDQVANLRALNVGARGGTAFAFLRLLGRLVR